MLVHERASSPGKGLSSLCRKANETAQSRYGSCPKSGQSPVEGEDEIGSAKRAASHNKCGKWFWILVRADDSSGDRFRVGRDREPKRQPTRAAVTLIAFKRGRFSIGPERDVSKDAVCDFDAFACPITCHPDIDTDFH
jgi:hypothetical protein